MSPANVLNKPTYLVVAEDLRGNPGQRKAYESQKNCVILAGPGSGKTKIITIKVARILNEDIRLPRGIACITYNAECARELKRRLDELGVVENSHIFIGTVHSFCLKNIILPYGKIAGLELPEPLSVAIPKEQDRLMEMALLQEKGDEELRRWKIRLARYRRTYLDRDSLEWKNTDEDAAQVIEAYEAKLRKNGFIDFDDMMLLGLQLVEKHEWIRKLIKARFPVLVVDEYQDLGVPLHRMVLSLCFKAGVRLIAVGDPDQSIYGFTGAKPELLEKLAEMEGIEQVRLRLNYRCGETIVKASQITLGEKRGYDARPGAHKGTIDIHECPGGLEHQAETICNKIIPNVIKRRRCNLGDIAVLYLDKNMGDVIAEKVNAAGLPFIRIDQNAPYQKTPLIRWLEDCALWCSGGWKEGKPRLSALIQTWLAFNRNDCDNDMLLTYKRGLIRFLWANRRPEMMLHNWLSAFQSSCLKEMFSQQKIMRDEKEAFERLIGACAKGGRIENFIVAAFAGQGGSPEHLNLLTLHSSKGSEFDVVVIMGMDQGLIPRYGSGEGEKREQRRLFYVGLTRSRNEVHLTYSGWTKNKYGRKFNNGPSEFLIELRDSVLNDDEGCSMAKSTSNAILGGVL
ncbi:DNA/RNA helicase, superfamily I [Desulfoscipio gibsoniae DSM 7213]|uniref:DNA 3'-5' helicase n=2 Tax=Desulfoscipio gibsoniae TaxID=102134 RepID=R4KEF5_9FIRM|nr:DNA/RNA helicase, superfamily I [Desulfoscipio gibsoniae DSM 7213]